MNGDLSLLTTTPHPHPGLSFLAAATHLHPCLYKTSVGLYSLATTSAYTYRRPPTNLCLTRGIGFKAEIQSGLVARRHYSLVCIESYNLVSSMQYNCFTYNVSIKELPNDLDKDMFSFHLGQIAIHQIWR